jgi:L-threonylcarbamoyladenylate synthase
LCKYTGIALVSTSANRHGRPPAKSAAAVYREFGDNVDFVLAGTLGGSAKPSEIRDVVPNRVVRIG